MRSRGHSILLIFVITMSIIPFSFGDTTMSRERLQDKNGLFSGSLERRQDGTTVLRDAGGLYQGSVDKSGTVRNKSGLYQGKGGALLLDLLKK